jgi:hypothetical protein
MIELKVQCDCGQKYKFDVDPINGQMPVPVACPVCGADGTEKANALLQQIPPEPAAQPPGPKVPVVVQPRLRISSSLPAASLASPPVPAPAVMTPPRLGGLRSAPAVAGKSRGQPNFGLGLLGGALGALVGSLIYFLIFKYTGFQIKLLALGVGALAGWGAELLGRGEGSNELGSITAVLVLVGIVGAQYFVALGWWHEFSPVQILNSAYTNSVREAKEAVKAVPTGSDEEIRSYLAREQARENAEAGEKPDPASITKEDIKEFREQSLPKFQELASGKMNQDQYNAKNGIDPTNFKKAEDGEEGTFKGIFLLLLLSRINIVSLCGAAGLAYKMSTNA